MAQKIGDGLPQEIKRLLEGFLKEGGPGIGTVIFKG